MEDPRGATRKNKKIRVSSSDDEVPEVEEEAKRSSSFPPSTEADFSSIVSEHLHSQLLPDGILPLITKRVVDRFLVEQWPKIEPWFRQAVREQTDGLIKSHLENLVLGKRILNREEEDEIGKDINTRERRLRLYFSSRIAPEIFKNDKIRDENGETLKVEICDVSNFNRRITITTGPLSNAQIEFVILEDNTEKFGWSSQREDEISWASSDFDDSELKPRLWMGKGPLIIGTDVKLYLENGVGSMENLTVTDNSSWTKTKCFRLGAKITDKKILAEFPRIQEAVSQPFQVKEERGKAYKKHPRPSWGDPVWRLEGIGKGGVYDTNLSSTEVGIKTVGDFLNAYWRDPIALRKSLGQRVCNSTWDKMIKNAQECLLTDADAPSTYNQSSKTDLVLETNNQVLRGDDSNENLQVHEQMNPGDNNGLPYFSQDQQEPMGNFKDPSTPHGEASTSYGLDCNTYYQGVGPSYCQNPTHSNI